MKQFHRSLRPAVVLAAGLLALGCGRGPRTVTVTGKVTRGGRPVVVSRTGSVQVTLVPVVRPGQPFSTYPGRAKGDGSFEIPDVPPGKYRAAVEVLDPTPQWDRLRGAFSPQNSRIILDLDGKVPLELDLARWGL
jgi:hypothetical protein